MKKQYLLDFSIVKDSDRNEFIKQTLDMLEKDPTPSELEQMAFYILCGKDENGENAIQRGEILDKEKRYKSYKTKDDKVQSLDEIMETPGFDEQQIRSAYKKDQYKVSRPSIEHPKYDKEGNLISIGDADIPGMVELWERLDHLDKWLMMLQGKIPPEPGYLLFEDDYRLYRLKHNLIEMKKTQYYMKDVYKPAIHFQKLDHPKAQFYDWTGDSYYWISRDTWEKRVSNTYTSTISRNINDYETRGEGPQLEVKWMVRHHNFDWENYKHIHALLNNYLPLYEQLKEKLDTYGRTLIWDMDRYLEMTPLSPIKRAIAEKCLQQMPREQISEELAQEFGITYNIYYLSTLIANDIPKEIARTALRHRLLCETPEAERKICKRCGRDLPRHPLFYTKNSGRKDGYQSYCRECERLRRIEKGGQNELDRRKKDTPLLEMQARASD